MKKIFVLLFALYASSVFSQKMLYDDIICPNGGEKGSSAVTYNYWNKTNLYYYFKTMIIITTI